MKGIEVCSIEGPSLFKGEVIMQLQKYINKFEKSSSPEFHSNLAQSILRVKGFQVCSDEGLCPFPRGELENCEFKKIFLLLTTGPISAKFGTNHPWVKGILDNSK